MNISKKVIDATILVLYFIIATILLLKYRLNYLISILFYFGFPIFYLFFRYPEIKKRILLFSIPLGLAIVFFADYLATLNLAWINSSIFPFKMLKVLPIEDLLFGILMLTAIISVYEVFIDIKHKKTEIGKNYKFFVLILIIVFIAFLISLIKTPKITYAHAVISSLAIPIFIYIVIKHPILIPKLLKISLILFFFAVTYEIVALNLGYWRFPGEYISFISVLNVHLPVEEFVLWIILMPAVIVALFEEFEDDLK